MKTVNSLSGGKTSSYIAKHYPADYNVFALVTTSDINCIFPDQKIRQIVSDRIGREFIGTLEEDAIIYTMLDLEQFIGQDIKWLVGKTFDEVILREDKKYLPNTVQRFCSQEMKQKPIYEWWKKNFNSPVEMRIGYRANETRRAKSMLDRCSENGILTYKDIVGKRKTRNKWADIEWQKPSFPLIEDNIYKDHIEKYWKDKPVRFAYMNNCVGCFHRNPVLLKYMSDLHPNKYQWFVDQENNAGYGARTFKINITYEDIRKSLKQMVLFEDDFTDCDSGYCGL